MVLHMRSAYWRVLDACPVSTNNEFWWRVQKYMIERADVSAYPMTVKTVTVIGIDNNNEGSHLL